jgi:hypothetical protein
LEKHQNWEALQGLRRERLRWEVKKASLPRKVRRKTSQWMSPLF